MATNYVQIRTAQQRIAYASRNVEIQRGSLRLAEARLRDGKATALDVKQARSNLAQTESSIPPLAISLRQANNRLCVLLGLPPEDLTAILGETPIPATPPEAAVGIPAQLLQHRPDVRRALRDATAQSARIGVAEADFYPQIGVTGFLGYAASDIHRLFAEKSLTGLILPTFSWRILNYGRVLNNVRNQDARFQEKVFQYRREGGRGEEWRMRGGENGRAEAGQKARRPGVRGSGNCGDGAEAPVAGQPTPAQTGTRERRTADGVGPWRDDGGTATCTVRDTERRGEQRGNHDRDAAQAEPGRTSHADWAGQKGTPKPSVAAQGVGGPAETPSQEPRRARPTADPGDPDGNTDGGATRNAPDGPTRGRARAKTRPRRKARERTAGGERRHAEGDAENEQQGQRKPDHPGEREREQDGTTGRGRAEQGGGERRGRKREGGGRGKRKKESQQTVLKAGQEVEDALVAFLQYQLQAQSLEVAVKEAEDSVVLVQAQYQGGLVDFNRVFTAQSQLVTQQDQLAIARGNIASSLIAVYRALGGGWQAVENGRPPTPCRT